MTPQNRARMREVIGRAVRTGLFPGGVGEHEHAYRPVAHVAAPTSGRPPVEQFTAALEALAGTVHRAGSLSDVVEIIVAQAARLKAKRILAWSDEAIGLPGLSDALAWFRQDGRLP